MELLHGWRRRLGWHRQSEIIYLIEIKVNNITVEEYCNKFEVLHLLLCPRHQGLCFLMNEGHEILSSIIF
jgi:hypothetical protein